jgi:O-acetyl-ADP-ribose deacetylase (regulator of RNase III)
MVRQSTARRTAPRSWRAAAKPEESPAITATPVFYMADRLAETDEPVPRVYLLAGDIIDLRVDAIVSNADADGRMWTAIASSVKASAGGDVERESVDKGPFELGQAWHTEPGSLEHLKRVIHVAAIDRHGNGGDTKTIRTCIRSALDVAVDLKLQTLAIPAIGTGKNALSLNDWIVEVGAELGDWFEDHSAVRLEVVVVLLEPTNFKQYAHDIEAAATAGALAGEKARGESRTARHETSNGGGLPPPELDGTGSAAATIQPPSAGLS